MKNSEFWKMRMAFNKQFGQTMQMTGHCVLSVQFYIGWNWSADIAEILNRSTSNA